MSISTKKAPTLNTLGGVQATVAQTADRATAEALSPVQLVRETDWFELHNIRVKAVQVAPAVYQSARSYLRAVMRNNMPEAPMQEGPDGKKKPNTFHPDYRKALAEWEALYADIDEDLFIAVAILAGLQIHPEDVSKIPPSNAWLPSIEPQLRAIGINIKTSPEFLMYGGDDELFNELMFKKYVLLNRPEIYRNFMNFQKESPPGSIPMELLSRYSNDMFRGQEGAGSDLSGGVEGSDRSGDQL